MKIKTATEQEKMEFEKPHIPEGLYKAKLIEVQEDVPEGKYGQRVIFRYVIPDHNAELDCWVYVPKTATPANKFGQILQAHNVSLATGEVETAGMVGSEAMVLVEDYNPNDADGNPVKDESGNKIVASVITKVKPIE